MEMAKMAKICAKHRRPLLLPSMADELHRCGPLDELSTTLSLL